MNHRAAVVDLDGTVYRGDALLPGARRGIDALREAGLAVRFFSNNPTRSPAAFAERLEGMGLAVAPDDIRSAAVVTAEYLAREHPNDRLFVVGSSGLRAQLRGTGLALTDDPTACDVLVASYDRGFDYDDMTAGLCALEAGAVFVGTDPDLTIPTADGRSVPGSGAVINAIAGVAGCDPDVVVGKPSREAVDAALAGIDATPAACLVVGDRLDTDVAMGDRAGMTTVLVRTGVTDDAGLAASDLDPDHVIDSLGDVGAVLGAD